MSFIITDDKHYKNIANSIRSKMQTDREYYPKDMAIAIDNIPSSADGTAEPIGGIYFLNPNDNGYMTKIKITGIKFDNKEKAFQFTFNDTIFRYIEDVEFINCDFKCLPSNAFNNCRSLKSINLPDSLIQIDNSAFIECVSLLAIKLPNSITRMGYSCFLGCISLKTINFPSSLISIGYSLMHTCSNLEFVTFGDNFNCNKLDLSVSTLYTRETILQWLNALADRTGQTAYTLIIGNINLKKITDEDLKIASKKNWIIK